MTSNTINPSVSPIRNRILNDVETVKDNIRKLAEHGLDAQSQILDVRESIRLVVGRAGKGTGAEYLLNEILGNLFRTYRWLEGIEPMKESSISNITKIEELLSENEIELDTLVKLIDETLESIKLILDSMDTARFEIYKESLSASIIEEDFSSIFSDENLSKKIEDIIPMVEWLPFGISARCEVSEWSSNLSSISHLQNHPPQNPHPQSSLSLSPSALWDLSLSKLNLEAPGAMVNSDDAGEDDGYVEGFPGETDHMFEIAKRLGLIGKLKVVHEPSDQVFEMEAVVINGVSFEISYNVERGGEETTASVTARYSIDPSGMMECSSGESNIDEGYETPYGFIDYFDSEGILADLMSVDDFDELDLHYTPPSDYYVEEDLLFTDSDLRSGDVI